MRQNGKFSLFLVSFICVAVFGFAIFNVIERTEAKEPTVTEFNLYPQNSITEVTPQPQDSAAAPTDTTAVLGAITEQFLSPYRANTAYNNIYLNNRTSESINLSELLREPSPVKSDTGTAAQVLVVHTHTSEGYMTEEKGYYTESDLTRTSDNTKNVVAAGKVFCDTLNSLGIATIHDTTVHDTTYTGSYSRSAETVSRILSENPSIKVVIDIHRDSVSINSTDKAKPTTTVADKKAAQVMLVVGCGEKTDVHKNWRQNLRFAVKYQQTMEVMYKGLARSINFVYSHYNQHLCPGSVILEIGTEANTVEEATYSATLAARAFAAYFKTLE